MMPDLKPQQSSDSGIPRRSGNCKLPELIDVPTYREARHAEVLGYPRIRVSTLSADVAWQLDSYIC